MDKKRSRIIMLMHKYGKLTSHNTLEPAPVDILFLDELDELIKNEKDKL